MTTQDQNKKTLRQFQCRDYLWETFEQMSGELECSVDYLINEAMRQYARSRNYGAGRGSMEAPVPQHAAAPVPTPVSQVAAPVIPAAAPIPSLRQNAPARPSMPVPPPRPMRPSMPPPQTMSSPPPPRTATMGGQAPPQTGPQARQSMPPPLPPSGGSRNAMPQAQSAQRAMLYAIFNGQKIPVAKDEFIIGRGSKSADLAIKDGNISRRHAAVVFHNGAYYMKDLGSTNGIEYQGRRFDTKRIDEGDAFRICDYEIRFTYS